MCSEIAGKALAGSATGILMLTGNAGAVVMIIAMEAVKGDSPSFFPAVVLMIVVLAVTITTSLLVPETYGNHGKTGAKNQNAAPSPV